MSTLPDPTLAVVVSDFGRDAAIRFTAALAAAEQACLKEALGHGGRFMDEHRRIVLSLVGDLPFVKERVLRSYGADGRDYDDGLLVGFPGGPTVEEVAARIGVQVLEALEGPLRRGCRRALVLIPCNTLAPASWWLERRFGDEASLAEMVREAGTKPWPGIEDLAAIVGEARLDFPTVPGAALRSVDALGCTAALPLGTDGIAAVYEEAARRGGSSARPVPVRPEWQDIAFTAIRAAISGDPEARRGARAQLEELAVRAEEVHGPGLSLVEACTDLDYGVGLDSTQAYAEDAIRQVYGEACQEGR